MRRRSSFGRNNSSNDLMKYAKIALAIFVLFMLIWKPNLRQSSVEEKIETPSPQVYK